MLVVVFYYWVVWPKEAFSFQMCLNAPITVHTQSILSHLPFPLKMMEIWATEMVRRVEVLRHHNL